MKKSLLFCVLFYCIASAANAQNYRLWATYYGGSGLDAGYNLTTDIAGNVYLTGQTESVSGIATAGAHQLTSGGGGTDAYLVKFDGAGNRLWATYYGGSGSDYGFGVKVDGAGNVYMTGYTSSTDSIASPGSYQTTMNGTTDAFIVKFNASGVRLWGSYYGGVFFDQGMNIAFDATNNVYLAGYTVSTTNIASPGAYQTTYGGGGSDAFLAKFSSSGAFQWGTYLGGVNEEGNMDIASDTSGNVVLAGYTASPSGISTPGSFQNTYGGGQDAYIAKFNGSGNLLWSTYYGGVNLEYGFGIAVGPGNVIYLGGQTFSPTGIASGGFQNTPGGGGLADAFLVKFDSNGNRIWGTYYGGSGTEEGNDVAVNSYGDVFLAGDAYSLNIGNCIATNYGFQTSLIGSENYFLAAFLPSGQRVSSTYYGRVHEEEGHVTVNSFGDIYMAGYTPTTTGVTSGGFQNTYGGGLYDALLVKFAAAIPHEPIPVPNDSLPPTPPSPTTSPVIITCVDIFNGGGISWTNVALKNFSPGTTLPASGSSIITFTCDFSASYSSSGPTVFVTAPATVKMKVDFSSVSGTSRVYDVEILQLDIAGGTLPTGMLLRESPTKISPGELIIADNGGGQYLLSGSFIAFTELSSDNGENWQANSAPLARLVFENGISAAIPTLGEWGLICLGILMLGFGVFYIQSKGS